MKNTKDQQAENKMRILAQLLVALNNHVLQLEKRIKQLENQCPAK